MLTRNITAEDWRRCAFYTPRIRHFGYNDLESYAIPGQLKGSIPTDRSIYMALLPSDPENMTRSTLLTFPKLRSCKLLQHTSFPIPHYSPFLTQTLVSLEVRPPAFDDDGYLLGVLRSVSVFSLSLRNLEIQGCSSLSSLALTQEELHRRDLGIQEALVQTLRSLKCLESLVCLCVHLPKNAVRYLATETKIRVLHIKNSAEHVLNALLEEETCFSYLEDLLLGCDSTGGLAQCSQLLERVDNIQNLRSLEIWRDQGSPAGSELSEFFQSLHNLIASPTSSNLFRQKSSATNTRLEKLCIQESPSFIGLHSSAGRYTITLDTLEPLLSCTRLTHLRLTTEDRYAFNDSDAYKMANAWPTLQELQLGFPGTGWSRIGGEESRLTLEGLRTFARQCKDLKRLGVCFDIIAAQCERRDEDDNRAEEIVRRNNTVQGVGGDAVRYCDSLEVLNVGDSVYSGEPKQVARSLLEIFPRLRSVAGPDVATSVEWQRNWVSVTLLIRQLSERLSSFY